MCKTGTCMYLQPSSNSLWPSDAIWWQWYIWVNIGSGNGFCLTTPSHYLNQWGLLIRGVLWHSPESNFTRSAHEQKKTKKTKQKKPHLIQSRLITNIYNPDTVQLNSFPPRAAYMRRRTGSELVQIMACCLDGPKPLSEPMLPYYQLDPKEHISMKFYLKFKYFHAIKCIWTCRLWNGSHFVQGEMS